VAVLLTLLIGARLGLRPLALAVPGAAAVSIARRQWPEPWQFSRAFLPNRRNTSLASPARSWCGKAQGLGSYLPVLGAVLVLCIARGGVEKLLPPLVWTVCLAAQLLPADAGSRNPRSFPRSRGQWVVSAASYAKATVEWPLRLLAATLRSRPLVWLGALSYGIYLVNEPVKVLGLARALIAQTMGGCSPRCGCRGRRVAGSHPWGLHEWIEAPALRQGRAMARRSMAASTLAAAPISAG
jgi:peptidoglycan/LPS O-acetylase OafA/YrhL